MIELVLPKRDLTVRARLLEGSAPRTCELVWQKLPIEAPTIHGWYSGSELYTVFPWDGEAPPRENTTVCTDAGDLFFYYAPWYRVAAAASGEIAIYYGRDAIPMGSESMMAGSLFAEIVSDRGVFADTCESIWTEGAETLIVRRGGQS